jgi:hypothetical protein
VTGMLTVSTAALTAVAVMGALRAFAPVPLIAVAMAVVMLIIFSHLFHLLSSSLLIGLPSCPPKGTGG